MMTDPRDIEIADYEYDLPDERIARHPLAQRDACRLLVADGRGVNGDHIFKDLPSLLPTDALLVCNNTRVINARLRFRRATGAAIEIFCLEPVSPADYERNFASTGPVSWHCFVGNSKRWRADEALVLPIGVDGIDMTLTARRSGLPSADGSQVVTFELGGEVAGVTFARVVEAAGVIPIPPYLNRETESTDSTDYQTVYSRIQGSVAAPTAGLHFTPELLQSIADRGIGVRELTLHVGAGTFAPVKSANIGEHAMHSEFIVVDSTLIAELADTPRPVIAVGTTSVRTLESLYHIGCLIAQGRWTGEVPQWYPYSADHPHLSVTASMQAIVEYLDATGNVKLVGATRLIIAPGYRYRIVRGMVTNFHQPGSTLLLLVAAMIGPAWHAVYDHALRAGYRFLSYGDACLFTP